jgi:membrane protease YdiL (CAAX protease family)
MGAVWTHVLPDLANPVSQHFGVSWAEASAIIYPCELILGAGLLLVLISCWERKELRSVGITKPSLSDILIAVLCGVLNLSLMAMLYRIRSSLLCEVLSEKLQATLLDGSWLFILIADVLCEELGPRAYVIERTNSWTANIWLAGSVSFLVSVTQHAYSYGLEGGMRRAPAILLLVILYVWRRNLPTSMLAHFLMDEEQWLILRLPANAMRQILRLFGFPL